MADAGLNSSVKGLQSFIKGMELVGDNIANMRSTGHKKSGIQYTDSFSNILQRSAPATAGGSNKPTISIGSGSQIAGIVKDFNQGSLVRTGDPAHMAVQGKGWFKVSNPVSNEEFATRNGSFRTDVNNYIVTLQDGYRLQGAIFDQTEEPTYTVTEVNGELVYTQDTPPGTPAAATLGSLRLDYDLSIGSGITKSGTFTFTDAQIEAAAPKLASFSVNSNGALQVTLSNGDSFTRGQVLLMEFADEQALVSEGRGLFAGFAAAGVKPYDADSSQPGSGGLGLVNGSTLEESNVDITEEFAVMITTQKSIQALARMASVADRTLEEVVNLKR